MSINNATPSDWDRLRKQAPAIEPTIDESMMKVYIDAAEEELTKNMRGTEWWKQHVARKEQLENEKRWDFPDVWTALKLEPYEFEKVEEQDVVNNPDHYNIGNIECIEAIEESMSSVAFKGYLKGNCMKYLWRYDYKGKQVEDLEKAGWYLNKLTGMVTEENS